MEGMGGQGGRGGGGRGGRQGRRGSGRHGLFLFPLAPALGMVLELTTSTQVLKHPFFKAQLVSGMTVCWIANLFFGWGALSRWFKQV